jgi:hypothetical protein
LAEFADLNAAQFVGLIVLKNSNALPLHPEATLRKPRRNNVIANRGLGFKRPIR